MLILWAVKQWTFPLFYRRLACDDSRPGLRKPVRRPRPPIHTRRSFSPEEWSVLSDTARCEGVAPLLHYTLETAGRGEEVPGDVRQSLYQEYLNAGAANVRLYHELSRIVKALQPTGDLPIVVPKVQPWPPPFIPTSRYALLETWIFSSLKRKFLRRFVLSRHWATTSRSRMLHRVSMPWSAITFTCFERIVVLRLL